MEDNVVYRNDDSYCGPISMLTRLPDGELLLAFREAKWRGFLTHKDPTTRTSVLRSRDNGRTWFSHVTPDCGGGNGAGITSLSDGSVMISAFHWLSVPPECRDELVGYPRFADIEEQNSNFAGRLNLVWAGGGVFVTRSTTDGYSWERPWKVEEPADWPDVVSHDAPLELPDGDLLLPATARQHREGQPHGIVLRSRDKGETWGEPVCITDDAPEDVRFAETRLVLCPSGRIIAMHRTKGNYWQNISTDGGHSWGPTTETSIWCGGSSPASMLVLGDGRLLLTRGYRREPYGVRAYISENEGDKWEVEKEMVLRDDAPDWDVGYPSTVETSEGEFLTVYYWHDADGIRHLQRTHWRLSEFE